MAASTAGFVRQQGTRCCQMDHLSNTQCSHLRVFKNSTSEKLSFGALARKLLRSAQRSVPPRPPQAAGPRAALARLAPGALLPRPGRGAAAGRPRHPLTVSLFAGGAAFPCHEAGRQQEGGTARPACGRHFCLKSAAARTVNKGSALSRPSLCLCLRLRRSCGSRRASRAGRAAARARCGCRWAGRPGAAQGLSQPPLGPGGSGDIVNPQGRGLRRRRREVRLRATPARSGRWLPRRRSAALPGGGGRVEARRPRKEWGAAGDCRESVV